MMNDENIQSLPLGRSSFEGLRKAKCIYIDKTDLIYKLCKYTDKIFLARPRRFGKTLLTSTMESLFKYGLRDFKGLAIEKLWKDTTYNVVHLDFSEINKFSDLKGFQKDFFDLVSDKFGFLGFNPKEGRSVFRELSNWLEQLPVNSLVYLIDEYDAPLNACLHDKILFENVRDVLAQFFNILKSKDGCMRFFFMTGIAKYSSTGIFSGFNVFTDISLNVEYGTLLGWTEDEIRTYFSDHLENAADVLHLSVGELIDNLRTNYDGFCFDAEALTHVYCPWSVLKLLKYPREGFKDYWYSSAGQPSVLVNYLINHELSEPEFYSQDKSTSIDELTDSMEFEGIDPVVLLTQAGYLTIKQVEEDDTVILGYPNREVSRSMAKLYARNLLAKKKLRQPNQPLISKIFSGGSFRDVMAVLNNAVIAIDYQSYPIKDEASCRAYIQVLLLGAAMLPNVEVHNALGRSDLEVDIGNRHWVFEFKYAENAQEVPSRLVEAVEQMKSRRYGEAVGQKELIRVALVFDANERQFTAFEEIK